MTHYSSNNCIVMVGCGRISSKHIEALQRLNMLRGVYDLDINLASETAKKYNVKHYLSFDEICADKKVSTVSICTPSGTHFKTSMLALESGLNVVVEKPMALRTSDARKMVNLANEKGLLLFVVKQNRFNPAIRKLRSAFDSGELGLPIIGSVRVRWSRPQEYYDQANWRGKYETDGGIISNQASHHIDILQWFLGEVDSVSAIGTTTMVDIEAENTCAAHIKFKSGAIGVIEATGATVPKDLEGSFSLLGEKGSVVVGGFAMNEISSWQLQSDKTIVTDEYKSSPKNVYGFGHELFYETVKESIDKNSYSTDTITGSDGLKSLILIEAIYESMHRDEKVFIPLKTKLSLLGETNEV